MSKRISIICAPPHGEFNPGMHSVDLGAFTFFLKNNFHAEVHFCLLHHPEPALKRVLDEQLPFTYELFYEKLNELYTSDLIIYWGDFLQMLPFHKGLSGRLVKYGIAQSEDHGLQIIRRHFLLAEAPDEVLAKTIVFGSNFFINENNHFLDTEYGPALKRFVSNIKRIWTRDILSAMRVAHLKKDYTTSYLGIDCSFFYDYGIRETRLPLPVAREATPKRWWKKQIATPASFTCGLFLGRMPDDVQSVMPFISGLAERLDANLEYLPWFWQSEKHYQQLKNGLPGIQMPTIQKKLMELYDAVTTYNFIITDTYHLCLNAWRMGVPAICIGKGSSAYGNTPLTDKKKELFYSMYGAGCFYVFLEDILRKQSRQERIEKIIYHITSHEIVDGVINTLQINKKAVEAELKKVVEAELSAGQQ